MIEVPGYHITDVISEHPPTVTCRAYSQEYKKQVILKVLNSEYPTAKKLTEFRKEFEITQQINHTSIVRVLDLQKLENGYVLIKEDSGGESLKRVLDQTRLEIPTFLKLAIQLVDAIGHIHDHQVIHKDIKPSNIIVDLNSGTARITDFSIATTLSHHSQQLKRVDTPQGTMAYMSPEQTGRMNRGVDYRSDFYSLGVTLYEIVTGTLPFKGTDAMELVHAHIAREPEPPTSRDEDVPKAISDIILKLMEKKAEDRYQSTIGIKRDLERCLEQWQENRAVEPFELGEFDTSGKFRIPEKLYGRERETQILFNGFEEACDGQSVMIEVTGHAGIGKTALINEIQKQIVRHRGRFLTGKFDQYNAGTPYTPLIEAFRQLARQILTETDEAITEWKARFLDAFGDNGQIINDVIPEFEHIIGKQPEPQDLPPNESKNRFNRLFRSLVRTVADDEHPLVLFLDDVQWGDTATLDLIKQITSDRELGYFYLIMAYRTEPIDDSHPVRLTLDEIKSRDVGSHTIHLDPLKEEHLQAMIADTLHKSPEEVDQLVETVHDKTNGNPFFVGEFLKTMHRDGLIGFDRQQGWSWNSKEIERQGITDNVVELMTDNIGKLEPEIQRVLKVASCIGVEFDLKLLADLLKVDSRKVFDLLQAAMDEGLIQPVTDYTDDLFAFSGNGRRSPDYSEIEFMFMHDRVRQAAYSLLATEEQQRIRYNIGHLWLQHLSGDEQQDKVFEIANNLNAAIPLIEDDEERLELADLNVRAGKRATSTAAYESAHQYFGQGTDLLKTADWDHKYHLCYQLYLGRGEAEYLVGEAAAADEIMQQLFERSKSDLDQAEVLNKQTVMHSILGNNETAIDCGIDALRLLGEHFPKARMGVRGSLVKELVKAWQKLRSLSLEEIMNLPELSDPRGLKIMEVAINLTPPTFFSDQEKYMLNGLKMLNYSLKHGNSKYSSYAYGIYGMVLGAVFGKYQRGHDFGDLALQMNERFDNKAFEGKLSMVYSAAIQHWITHAGDCIPVLHKGYKSAAESGDLLYAGLIANGLFNTKLYAGRPLNDLLTEARKYHDFMRNSNDINNYRLYRMILYTIRQLSGEEEETGDKPFSEDEYITGNRNVGHDFNLMYYYVYKARHALIMGHMEKGWEYISKATDHRLGGIGSIIETECYFYEGLLAAANWEQLGPIDRRKLALNIRRLEKRRDASPSNLQHKVELLKAEQSRINGTFEESVGYYDRAIESADDEEFLHIKAIANERAARFFRQLDNENVARMYLREAHFSYQTWQANLKCDELMDENPWLQTRQRGNSTSITDSSSSTSRSLDIQTVMKASQNISSEIIFEDLLRTMMQIVIENAGAQKGCFIRKHDTQYVVVAQGNSNWDDVLVNMNKPVDDSQVICSAIVHYVARTQEVLFLEDALNEGLFTGNKYVKENKIRSVLCSPIFHQGKLVGMIYLENNLTDHAFTESHLEVLNILSSQLAISLENAKLYNEMRELNKELKQEIEDRKRSEEERIKIMAESRRKTEELEQARNYQLSMLPDHPPEMPDMEIATFLKTASEVGGDYYDFFPNGGDHMLTVTGDATGHGMSAGLMVAMTKAALNAIDNKNPREMLEYLNRVIRNIEARRLHMALNLVQFTDHRLSFSSAAMPPVFLLQQEQQTVEEILLPGPPIGSMHRVAYEQVEMPFNEGDALVMMSDGLPESFNNNDEQLGYKPIRNCLQASVNKSAEEIKTSLVELQKKWAGEVANKDDITILVIKRR